MAEKLLTDLGGKVPHHNPGGTLRRLNESFAAHHEKGRTVVVTLDEAHLLNDKGLLHTKTMLNHDRDSRLAVVIVLVGDGTQPTSGAKQPRGSPTATAL